MTWNSLNRISKTLLVLVAAALVAALAGVAFLVFVIWQVGASMNDESAPCSEGQTAHSLSAAEAAFPTLALDEVDGSSCAPEWIGVDRRRALLLPQDAAGTAIEFAPVDKLAEYGPLSMAHWLFPELVPAEPGDSFELSQRYLEGWNTGVFLLRRTDRIGPLIVIVFDVI